CHGHPAVRPPNLDKLASRGTRFASAYTNCPICVPARASFGTGRYVPQVRFWDNAIAYDGSIPSWGHRLMAQGHRVTSIGKLHYLRTDPIRNGFHEELETRRRARGSRGSTHPPPRAQVARGPLPLARVRGPQVSRQAMGALRRVRLSPSAV